MGGAAVSLYRRAGTAALSDHRDAQQTFRHRRRGVSDSAPAAVSLQFSDRHRHIVYSFTVSKKRVHVLADFYRLAGSGHHQLCASGVSDDAAERHGFQNI